jgi:hypothetical protein
VPQGYVESDRAIDEVVVDLNGAAAVDIKGVAAVTVRVLRGSLL